MQRGHSEVRYQIVRFYNGAQAYLHLAQYALDQLEEVRRLQLEKIKLFKSSLPADILKTGD